MNLYITSQEIRTNVPMYSTYPCTPDLTDAFFRLLPDTKS